MNKSAKVPQNTPDENFSKWLKSLTEKYYRHQRFHKHSRRSLNNYFAKCKDQFGIFGKN